VEVKTIEAAPIEAPTAAAELGPEVNLARLHDQFPDTRIRGCAKRLNVIADAWQAGVGGLEGVPPLLADAIRASEELREYLTVWCRAYGVSGSTPPRLSESSRHP
jgi:hypothetical protein